MRNSNFKIIRIFLDDTSSVRRLCRLLVDLMAESEVGDKRKYNELLAGSHTAKNNIAKVKLL